MAANKLESMMVGHLTYIRMIFILYDLLNYEFPRDLELSDTRLQVPSSTFKLGCIKYRELSLVLSDDLEGWDERR